MDISRKKLRKVYIGSAISTIENSRFATMCKISREVRSPTRCDTYRSASSLNVPLEFFPDTQVSRIRSSASVEYSGAIRSR